MEFQSHYTHVSSKAGIPVAMFSCTQLVRLEIFDQDQSQCLDWGECRCADPMHAFDCTQKVAFCNLHLARALNRVDTCVVMPTHVRWWRGAGELSDGITSLQRLARLRLQNVLTQPLTDSVSRLTNLTSLGLYSERYTDDDFGPLLPAAASALTGLQQLDVDGPTISPAVRELTGARVPCMDADACLDRMLRVQQARLACSLKCNSPSLLCAGLRDLTLRGTKFTPADLRELTTALRHLSRCTMRVCKGLSIAFDKVFHWHAP